MFLSFFYNLILFHIFLALCPPLGFQRLQPLLLLLLSRLHRLRLLGLPRPLPLLLFLLLLGRTGFESLWPYGFGGWLLAFGRGLPFRCAADALVFRCVSRVFWISGSLDLLPSWILALLFHCFIAFWRSC